MRNIAAMSKAEKALRRSDSGWDVLDAGDKVVASADIVVIDATTPEQAIAEIRQPLAVFKRGRRTVVRHPPELVRPQ